MNYQQNLIRLAQLAGDSAYQQDADFRLILPAAIEAAENRILRDLDLLATRVTDDTGKCTQNRTQFILPTGVGTFIVIEVLRPIVGGDYGQPLLPVTRETINMMWPSEFAPSQPSVPQYWAPIDQATIVIGPPPDQSYPMSCYGTMRPATLSPQNSHGTFISTQLPDLFLAAEMCWIFGGWQRNWSPQGDDPATAAGWEAEYTRIMTPALTEETRKKLQMNGWSSRLPSAAATPPQT